MHTRLVKKIVIVATLIAVICPGLLLIFLLNFNWNLIKPQVNDYATQALARPFNIVGDLSVSWDQQSLAAANSWRYSLPWPHFVARDIRIGNPPLAAGTAQKLAVTPLLPEGEMARVAQLDFVFNPFALLAKKITITVLRLDSPVVSLLRNADGRANWDFNDLAPPTPWQLEIQKIILVNGRLQLRDLVRNVDVIADVSTLTGDPKFGIAWNLRGNFNHDLISGYGTAGALLSLQQQITPYPLAATLHVGKTTISVDALITKPTDLAAIDAQLTLSGASMAELYPLLGVVLPETSAFSSRGHLIGTLKRHEAHWVYEKFSGKVGGSDLEGSLDFRTRPVRPLLTGTLTSHTLQLVDLAPLIGADSSRSKDNRSDSTVQPKNKVLPVEPFKVDRWSSIDASIKFTADKITLKNALLIDGLNTDVHLQAGVLSLLPLDFHLAGGSVNSTFILDGSKQNQRNTIQAKMTASIKNVKVHQLLAWLPDQEASFGEMNGEVNLSSTGNSVAALLATANGEIKASIVDGTVSKLMLEEMGLNIASIVLTKLSGDKQIGIDCLVADFAVKKGLMDTRNFLIDTDTAKISVNGSIDMAQEQLDLTVKPESKGVRLFSLRAPIYIRGSFAEPTTNIDKSIMALKVAGAVALGTLTPFAALIPLTTMGYGETNDCKQLLGKH